MADRYPKSGTALMPSFDAALPAPEQFAQPAAPPWAQPVPNQYAQPAPEPVAQQQYAQQQYAQQQYAQQQYAQPAPEPYAQQQYAQQQYAQPPADPYNQQYAQPAANQYALAAAPPGYAQPQQYAQQYAQQYQAQSAHALECPECGKMTTSLKQYNYMSYLLFVWFFAFWGVKRGLACPGCMRNDLLIKLVINVPLANILWPFLIMPWTCVQVARTFTEGHSPGAEAALRQAGA